ncbi:uncharacterized protein [Argopecten irradians]|uniref:uncharacterized protein n=1 Tax=Argopecten irradians TaxID=31199 RepID=UPI0037233AFE
MNKTITISNSTQEHEPVSSSTKQYELLWAVCIIAVFAIVEHSVILLLTSLDKTLRQKPFIVSILLLSTSDVLLSFALLIFLFVNLVSLRQTWICGLTNFLLQLGWVSSLVHTLVICTERYLATRPIQMGFFTLRKRQILTIISMGICSVILGIPYLFTVKEATIVSCTRINLFQDNWPYVYIPGRALSILIWMCTAIFYILTVNNLVRALRRSDWLRGRYFKHNAGLSAEGAIRQHDSNASRPHIGENVDVSTATNRPVKNSEGNVRDYDATS